MSDNDTGESKVHDLSEITTDRGGRVLSLPHRHRGDVVADGYKVAWAGGSVEARGSRRCGAAERSQTDHEHPASSSNHPNIPGSVDADRRKGIHWAFRRGLALARNEGLISLTRYRRHTHPAFLAVVAAAGCATPPGITDARLQERMLTLQLPSRIEIVEPFTRIRSFDDNATPDGIELLLQAVNSLDNPGLMIFGDVRVELFEYVPASGDQKGRRIDHWGVELRTKEHQRTHWNQITQMYEFRLRVVPAVIPGSEKYVLAVTYNSPLGQHLTSECLLRYQTPTGPLGGGKTSSRQ